ncbi:MAG: glycosyltransferase [Phocaeicola sp.]
MILFFYLEWILYGYLSLCVGYLLLFTGCSFIKKQKRKNGDKKDKKNQDYRFAILIPAYKEESVIAESVVAIQNQTYNKEHFDLYVIADQMEENTIQQLKEKGVNVSHPAPGESSKANALKSITIQLPNQYDYVVILDADNIAPPTYLTSINNYLNNTPCTALQTHRQAKNLTTPTAILDAAIEEMNNTIFRLGHTRLGLSSALIGSGMIFEYNWFATNVTQIDSAGEDKEFEEMLLRQRIRIHYAEEITFTDEKVEERDNLKNQRRRWLATQFMLLGMMYKQMPKALVTGNVDYVVKTIQSAILPRSILIATISTIALTTLFIEPHRSIKWLVLLTLLLFTLYSAIPRTMKNPPFYDALKQVPLFIGMMLLNLFRLKGASKKFIHTKHG